MQHSAHPTVMKDTHHVPKAWIPVSKNETFRHCFQWFRVTCVVAEREFYGQGPSSANRAWEFRWRARSYVISARPACLARRSPNHLPTPPIQPPPTPLPRRAGSLETDQYNSPAGRLAAGKTSEERKNKFVQRCLVPTCSSPLRSQPVGSQTRCPSPRSIFELQTPDQIATKKTQDCVISFNFCIARSNTALKRCGLRTSRCRARRWMEKKIGTRHRDGWNARC